MAPIMAPQRHPCFRASSALTSERDTLAGKAQQQARSDQASTHRPGRNPASPRRRRSACRCHERAAGSCIRDRQPLRGPRPADPGRTRRSPEGGNRRKGAGRESGWVIRSPRDQGGPVHEVTRRVYSGTPETGACPAVVHPYVIFQVRPVCALNMYDCSGGY